MPINLKVAAGMKQVTENADASKPGTYTMPVSVIDAVTGIPIPGGGGGPAVATQTPMASAAQTTTQTSADISTLGYRALSAILDVSNAGTGSVTVTINGKDPASGNYYNLLTGAAVGTISTNPYFVGLGVVAVTNVAAAKPLPATIQIVVTANNANSMTYSVSATLAT